MLAGIDLPDEDADEDRAPDTAGGDPAALTGRLFRRVLGDDVSEMAQVVAVTDDPMGRPHVRVVVWTLGRGDACAHEIRTMALSSFLAQFDASP
ncbi:hypothetical protein [Rhodospirillum centenum]|uniref:Uncharacterized protein n=1 Tax=Rhodospirillum centenum (strain ATCC 51521 / SW) TaxID=414684 RepID=B6ISZ0_RHOCS|nr:hypothetical protein [Rhodospirillum centenum]ACI98661.1 hypothetical protein RC1_1252 [Rhodospirillum centenum SW]